MKEGRGGSSSSTKHRAADSRSEESTAPGAATSAGTAGHSAQPLGEYWNCGVSLEQKNICMKVCIYVRIRAYLYAYTPTYICTVPFSGKL